MFSSKTTPSEKPPSKQGFLFKRGNNKGPKQMKQRWFALEANTLSYYKNNKLNSAPLGFISLSQVDSISARKEEEGCFEIKMQNDGDKEGRIYFLRARTNVEAEEWVVAVNESRKYYERGGLPSTESQEGALRLELQQKEREIEALARSLQLTKDLLDKEKKRANLILETERAEANKIREAQKALSAEVSALKAQLAEKEKQLSTYKELVESSDSSKEAEIQSKIALAKKPEEDLKEELECRNEELKEMKEKVKEKKSKIRELRKQLSTANEVFSLTASRMGNISLTESQQENARSYTNMSDSDSVLLMKQRMAEMKETMEKRMEELQEKLDAQIAENHKLDSDAAQWKSMAQKELKSRLNLESERASLQRQLTESRENSIRSQSSSRSKSSREDSTDYVTLPPQYEKGESSKPKSGYQPLEEEGPDGYYTKKGGGGNPKSSADCFTCSIA